MSVVLCIQQAYSRVMVLKITKLTLSKGAEELSKSDKDIARIVDKFGLPSIKPRTQGYNAILNIICGQQISTSAARAIGQRLALIESPMTHKTALKLGPDRLRSVGLSKPKVKYALGIAHAIEKGEFSFRKVAHMTDDAAIKEMTKLKGIGKWSAEVYLLFSLQRPDLWPAEDLGIIKGYTHLRGLKKYPDRKQMVKIGEPWRPWRSVAARLIWHYINSIEGRV